jgi:hypothetical protein
MSGIIYCTRGEQMWEYGPRMEQRVFSLDDDLKHLAPEDLARVRRWVEDRFVNAVCPLAVQLRLSMPENVCFDSTRQVALVAVERVLAAVDEVRRIDSEMVF